MGSKLGWVLSGVLVAAIIGFVVFKIMLPSPSSPTAETFRTGFLELQRVDVSPAVVLGAEPSEPGNAGDDYRLAVAVYRTNKDAIEQAIDRELAGEITSGDYVPELPVMEAVRKINEHLTAGARKKTMRYCNPARIVVKFAYASAMELRDLSDAITVLDGVYRSTKNGAELEKVLHNQFALGWHMMNERARAVVVLRGLRTQMKAVNTLEDLYASWKWEPNRHVEQLKGCRQYARGLRKVLRFYENKWNIVWKPRPDPGNIFRIIERDEDRAWRVDALLVLGAIRYTHKALRGDSRVTRKLIERFAKSSDPFEKAAAAAARDLTPEGFQQIAAPLTAAHDR